MSDTLTAEPPVTDAPVADIEAIPVPTHDEFARQRFTSALRKHAIVDMLESMRLDYVDRVAPAHAARGKADMNWREIEVAMEGEASYRFYSSLRYNAQEMCFLSVQDQVERVLPDMIEAARDAAARAPAGGTLRLDPSLPIPRYVSALDVHLTPGCFHSEYTQDDVAQGAVFALGSKVFVANQQWRMFGGVGRALGRWAKYEYPDLAPRRVLDIGTSSGKNLLPYMDIFPGIEAYGIDVGAPLLRYGHAFAEHEGKAVHFSQQNAEHTDFPDGHFDLIVSSFFFHEVPVKVTRNVLRECHRLLRPGGVMVHQELPAEHLVGAWENYYWNWDTENNNEPTYTNFRAQDPVALCAEAGFAKEDCFATTLPDVAAYPDRFAAFDWDEPGRPQHGRGGWYAFGARKQK